MFDLKRGLRESRNLTRSTSQPKSCFKASLSSYKESGGIEYTSDLLIAIQYRDMRNIEAEKDKNPRELEFSILKNRNGVAGKKIPFDYYSEFNYFEEV